MAGGRGRALTVALALVVALVAACGSGDDPPDEAEDTAAGAFPVTVRAANGEVRIDRRPERIVSLSPTATEMLFAVGAGYQVEAVDERSNFPPEAPVTDLSGFTPNLEAVAGRQPDLVVVSEPGDLVEGLARLDIPALLLPAAVSLDQAYAQIEQVGAATGHVGDAADVVARMRSRIEDLAEQAPRPAEPLTYYHELDSTLFSVTSDTFIGEVYALAGLRNVADQVDDPAGGYPQLSPELVISSDPDLIFLADTKCCGQSAETVAARPGWAEMTAVRAGRVVELDDDIASRWGPRVVELLAAVVAAAEEGATVPAGG